MRVLGLLLFISFSALAQDYTLYQAENDHYRDYTRKELMERIGESSSLLPYYSCNGRDELDVFWPAVRQNEEDNSLRINFYKSDEKIFYRKGQYFKLNGEIQADLSNEFVASVALALEKIEAMPEGDKLLRQLERSHFPLNIGRGNNSFNPRDNAGVSYRGIYQASSLSIFHSGRMTNENVPFQSLGTGGTINWNPKTEGLLPHIALAHEMYHAFDSIRGLLDTRFVQGEKYEFTQVSEYRAVYFENLARKASGVGYRTHYDQDQTGPGVLDELGEPIKIPSPCL
jgi:hypothetical protein